MECGRTRKNNGCINAKLMQPFFCTLVTARKAKLGLKRRFKQVF